MRLLLLAPLLLLEPHACPPWYALSTESFILAMPKRVMPSTCRRQASGRRR